jgi:hypothetical protein
MVKNELRGIGSTGQICYFLGAGFSKASKYQLPTADGFLSLDMPIYCRDAVNEKHVIDVRARPDLSGLLSRLEARYGDLNSLNLESVMSDLYERSAGLGRAWVNRDASSVNELLTPGKVHWSTDQPPPPDGSELARDYALLLLLICLRLRVVEATNDECPMVRRLLSSLRLRDSIITLNYDTIIEREWKLSAGGRTSGDARADALGYYIGLPSPGYLTNPDMLYHVQPRVRGFYAKLHGSVDWRSCREPVCPNHSYIESTDRSRPDTFDAAEQWHCAACASIPETVIIPPVASKSFDRFPKLRLMWLQAYHALRIARRWVFMGVSLAPTDMHLRSLLRAASEEWLGAEVPGVDQICIVNKDDSACSKVARRLTECLPPQVQAVPSGSQPRIATFASIDDYLADAERVDSTRPA